MATEKEKKLTQIAQLKPLLEMPDVDEVDKQDARDNIAKLEAEVKEIDEKEASKGTEATKKEEPKPEGGEKHRKSHKVKPATAKTEEHKPRKSHKVKPATAKTEEHKPRKSHKVKPAHKKEEHHKPEHKHHKGKPAAKPAHKHHKAKHTHLSEKKKALLEKREKAKAEKKHHKHPAHHATAKPAAHKVQPQTHTPGTRESVNHRIKVVEEEMVQIQKEVEQLQDTAKKEVLRELGEHFSKFSEKFEGGGSVKGRRTLLDKIMFGKWDKESYGHGGKVGTEAAAHRKHPDLSLDKGIRLPHGAETATGAKKKEDYSAGAKHIHLKKGKRLAHGYETEKGKKSKFYEKGGAPGNPPKGGFVPKYGIFNDRAAAEAQAKAKNATIQILPPKTVPAHVKPAHMHKGKMVPEKHVKSRDYPERYMVIAKA